MRLCNVPVPQVAVKTGGSVEHFVKSVALANVPDVAISTQMLVEIYRVMEHPVKMLNVVGLPAGYVGIEGDAIRVSLLFVIEEKPVGPSGVAMETVFSFMIL